MILNFLTSGVVAFGALAKTPPPPALPRSMPVAYPAHTAQSARSRGSLSPMAGTKKADSRPTVHYVYRITCLHPETTEKYYYGRRSCSGDPYADVYWSSSKSLQEAIERYGQDAFTKKIVAVYATRAEALAREVRLHAYFNVKDHPLFFNQANQTTTKFNLPADYSPSPETRAKIAAANATRDISPEHRARAARAATGHHHMDETKAKIGAASRARWAAMSPEERAAALAGLALGRRPHPLHSSPSLSPEQRAELYDKLEAALADADRHPSLAEQKRVNLSDAAKRRMEDPEQRAAIGTALASGRGKRAGTTHSAESKAKISASRKGQKLTEDTKSKISQATRGKTVNTIRRSKLSQALTGRQLSAEHKAKIADAIRQRAAERKAQRDAH